MVRDAQKGVPMSKSKVAPKNASSRKPAAIRSASRRTLAPLNSVDELLRDVREDKDLKPGYDLATSLILRGHAAVKFSGRTMKQWNATLRSPTACINSAESPKPPSSALPPKSSANGWMSN